MDANLKAAWVDALRTGKYRRSFRELWEADGSRCALGVAEALMGDSARYLGIPWNIVEAVMGMNDGRRGYAIHSWAEIADYIEANVPVDEPQPDISVFTRMLEPRELVTGDD